LGYIIAPINIAVERIEQENPMSFDLNISNYSITDLKEMFNVDDDGLHNPGIDLVSELETQERILKDRVRASTNIDKLEIANTIDFLTSAKLLLINKCTTANNIGNTTSSPFLSAASQPNRDAPINTAPSDFFAGTLNPIKKRTLVKNVNIDTRFRTNYSTSDACNFHVTLPTTIRDVLTMTVSSIEFPTTFYNISKKYGNNFFFIEVTVAGDVTRKLFEIPSGKYESDGLLRMMNAALLEMGGGFAELLCSVNVSQTGSGTGRFNIGLADADTSAVTNILVDFVSGHAAVNVADVPCTGHELDLPRKMGWVLGFRNGTYTDGTFHTSEGILDVSGNRYMYLAVDDFNNNVDNSFFGMFEHSLLNKTVLARIAVSTGQFAMVSANMTTSNIFQTRTYFGPVNISKLNIQLLDEYGRVMDLNQMDYSFCLSMETSNDL
jgi:hypothetical protein